MSQKPDETFHTSDTQCCFGNAKTSHARLPVHPMCSLWDFDGAVTASRRVTHIYIHLYIYIVLCETPRPHFWSTVFTAGAREESDGREETERWIAVFWNWYGNLLMCPFTAYNYSIVAVTVQEQSCEIQGFTGTVLGPLWQICIYFELLGWMEQKMCFH